MNDSMQTLIWDIPTRLFHWMLAGGFFTAAFIALVLGDDSHLFPYHAIIGLIISLMIFMRVIWGFVGSRYARFSSFAFGPRSVIEYIRGVLRGTDMHHIGHNPAGAYAIFTMLTLLLGLATTGLLMSQGIKVIEEIHEVLANAMIVFVALHILGVLFHTVRHRENIVASMFHGQKAVNEQAGIASSHLLAALIFCVVCAGWGLGLLTNYDATTQTTRLPIIGFTVQLGEVEDKHSTEESDQHDHSDMDGHRDGENHHDEDD